MMDGRIIVQQYPEANDAAEECTTHEPDEELEPVTWRMWFHFTVDRLAPEREKPRYVD